jgi:protoheme IX farnesyltransferase
LIIVFFLTILGTFILYYWTTPLATFLGLFNMFWYNAVYTPLKTKTAYVVLPGALTGAVPPMIGWVAAGGYLFDPSIISVAVFMFLWQIPHFWLLLLKYGKEYENAGFASLTSVVNDQHAKLIIFIWVAGTAVSSLLFPLLHLISNIYVIVLLTIVNILLISFFYKVVFNRKRSFQFRPAFYSIYLYQVIILLILMTG